MDQHTRRPLRANPTSASSPNNRVKTVGLLAGSSNLSETLGPGAVEKLVAAYGGTRIYVPVRADPAGALAGVIGLPAAEAFSRHYGGDRFDVPNPPASRRPQVLELRKRGMRTAQIARELRCTVQWVRRVLADEAQ